MSQPHGYGPVKQVHGLGLPLSLLLEADPSALMATGIRLMLGKLAIKGKPWRPPLRSKEIRRTGN